jgi:lipopolysaccharide exporter
MLQTSPSSLSEPSVVGQQPAAGLSKAHRNRWGFLRNVALLIGGTALAQGVSILLSPVITRQYTPANLGYFALFTTFINFFLVGTSLKYELGIVSADSEREAAQLGFLSLLFCLPMSLLAGGLLWILMHYALLGFGGLPPFTPLLIMPAIAAGGAFVALRYWFIRQERFGYISHNLVMQHGARALTQVGLGTLGPHATGLFVGEIAGRFTGLGRMLRTFWPSFKPYLRDSTLAEYRSILGKHRKLLVYSLGSSYLDTLAANLALPLLIQAYGSSAGGQFALVQRVLAVPLALISSSVADAFHSRMALHAREASSRMVPFFHRTTLLLLLAAGAPSILLLIAGPRLFGLVFGTPWTTAGTLAVICIPWFLTQFVVSPLSRLVFVLSGQESKLVYDIFVVLGVVAIFVIGRHLGMSSYHAVLALSVVNAVGYAVYYFILLRIVVAYSRAHCS